MNNVELVRNAYDAYSRGDIATLLDVVDPDLEWTFLDPSLPDPQPQVCHGRHELEGALRALGEHGLRADVEEIVAHGDRVLTGARIPGIDASYGRQGDDRVYSVLTVRDGRIVALRDCRSREEALRIVGTPE